MDPTRFNPSVVCIGEEGEFFADLLNVGIEATALRLGGNKNILRALIKLIGIMRRQRPDVVVTRGFNAETLGRLAARITGVAKTVVWVHFIGEFEPRGWLYSKLDHALIPWTSAFFGVAEAQKPYLSKEFGYPPEKIRIIHNGVDPAIFATGSDKSALADLDISKDDPVVGIVAALRPEKDHANLLHAARIVIADIPDAHFLIIGDGLTRSALERLTSELGISSNVHFLGMRSDISRLLNAIDVFTLSSKTVECFPIALLEAMACARPAVCTDVGGVGEMVGHGETGFLVPPENPQELAGRLTELLVNPSLAHQMGKAARRRLEDKFTLERSVREAEQAIEEVIQGTGDLGHRTQG
ncbi:MAG: glycosyltransferase [Mycobacterium sp.]|nr:glycosyltransferase [Mycobacterium sp.]